MKLGILGTGMIVKDLLQIYHQFDIDETYILGTQQTKEETEKLVENYHFNGTYYDYEEMLKSDIDTIYCALPNHLHFSFSKKALQAGKHVIIEKPITSHPQELEELIEIANQKKLMIFEAMNIHYLPSFLSLKKDIQKIGDVKLAIFNYSQYSSRYNAFKNEIILPAFDYHKSGGALMDINVYNLHALIGLFGTPLNNQYNANIEKNIDTSGIMTLDYGSFKAIAIGAKDCKAPLVNTIQGTEGCIIIHSPLSQMFEYTISYNNGENETKHFDNAHRLTYEFKEFIKMIKEKNYQKQQELLNLSLEISKVMKKGRDQQNIVFDTDKGENK